VYRYISEGLNEIRIRKLKVYDYVQKEISQELPREEAEKGGSSLKSYKNDIKFNVLITQQ
jgi:hypothetical protein